jgi:UV excision repair protein RAD23
LLHPTGLESFVIASQIDAEPTDFIGAIKSKIEQSQGFTPSSQKIIFSGKLHATSRKLSLT